MESDPLERARTAFSTHSWPDAYAGFAEADLATSLEPLDLERFATAAYLTGHDPECEAAWVRAHQAWHARDDAQKAVRCAFWLGFALVQRGEMAQGGGWLARAGRLVEELDLDTVERGYLMVPDALMAMGAGQPDAALDRFAQADALGHRFDDKDLSTLGLLGQGQALLSMGRTSEGLRLFDEAMVAVTAGETTPVVSGLVYCAVIDGCHQVFDTRRACEWTAALDLWCGHQPGLVPYRGQCLVHRSQVLQIRGDWSAAIAEVERARQWLSEPPHPAVGMAHYQLGELQRLRGDLAEAEAAYRRAHAAGREPQPGLALLRLAEGRRETAAADIESALGAADDQMSRIRLLPAHAEIMLAVGRLDDAQMAADELGELAAHSDATMLAAIADQIRGAVMVARGDPAAALAPLRAALDGWHVLDSPYEAARARMLLAVACWKIDDGGRAELECDAARKVFERVGAAPALAQLDRLVTEEAGRAVVDAEPTTDDSIVSARELEVLRLVAAGLTNRAISGELAISERTVERHLGNIFVKLGVSNRAAATAHAYEHNLLEPGSP